MVPTDWRDQVPRWLFWAVVFNTPLLWMEGPRMLFVVGFFVLLPFALLAVGRLGDVVKIPLSFSLPGFRESLRRRYFGAAVVLGLAGALFALELNLIFSGHEGQLGGGDLAHVCLQVVSAFLVGMTVSLIMGTPRLILSRLAWNVLMLLSIPLFVAAAVLLPALIEYPVVGIPVCGGFCVFVWLRLGDMAFVRRGHRMIVEDAQRQRVKVGGSNTIPPWAEHLLREQIDRRRDLEAGRYVWGSLYGAFSLWSSYWVWIVCGIVATGLVVGWFVEDATPIIAVIYLVFAGRLIRLPATSTLLLPGGRRERCRATLAVAGAALLLLLGAALTVLILGWLLGVLLPSVFSTEDAGGVAHRIAALAGLFLPCAWLPILLGLDLMREKDRGITSIVSALWFVSLILLVLWRRTWPDALRLWLVVAIFIFGWAFFLSALQITCRRRDLI